MPDVSCVRCGRTLPIERTDVVGTGYRCEACSVQALVAAADGEPDVGDNLDIATRTRLALRGKRTVIGGVVLGAAAFAIPAIAVGWTGGLWMGVIAGGVGLYLAWTAVGSAVDIGWASWRQFGRTPALPTAKLKRLPLPHGRGVADRDRVGDRAEQQDARLADQEQRAAHDDAPAGPADPARERER